jgi:hypothetical protein
MYYAALYRLNTDWFYIPVSLDAGAFYSFSIYAGQDGSTPANAKLTVSYGTSNQASSMTNSIISETNMPNSYTQYTSIFSPSSTGTYYIGIKGTVGDIYYDLYIMIFLSSKSLVHTHQH